MAEVSYADRRLTGSVTERLSARLDEVEAVQARMLKNEAKLIADSVIVARDVRYQEKENLDRMRDWLEHDESIQRLQCRTVVLSQATFWQRLRWLVTGR